MASAAFSAFPLVGPTAERPLQQAFVLRLSEDSLEALRELLRNDREGEGMELEFGEGETLLHIPNQPSFNLTPASLAPPTEFLSHPSSSSPYFLHSSAATRYTIRQTTVSAATKNKLRLGTEQAAKDKAERRIVQLEEDPVKSKGKGKGGASSSSSNKDGLPAHMRSKPLSSGSAGGSAAGSRGSSPAGGRMGGGALTPGGSPAMSSSTVRAGSRDGSNSLRTRIIQLLAMGPMSSRDLASKVKSREDDVLEVLNLVAKPPTNTRLYHLLPKSFFELDIFSWKPYSQNDRDKVLAATRHAFDVDLRLPKDAPERRILDPDFVKSPAKPAYATSVLGQSGSYGLGLGVGLGGGGAGSGSKGSASPLPPASASPAAEDSGSTLIGKGKKGAVTVVEKGKKKVSLSTTTSGVASKRKGRDDDDDEEDGEISEPPKASKSSAFATQNGNGNASDSSKRRRTIDPSSFSNDSTLLAPTPSTSSTSLNKSLLGPSSSHSKSHLSQSSSSQSIHVPTPYSSRPSTPLISSHPPPPPSSSHHSRRKASPTFTSSSGSSSGSPSSSRSSSRSPSPLNLPDYSPGALRKRFKSLWPEYESLNESLGREKERSEGILAGRVGKEGGEGKSFKEVKGEVKRRGRIHRELEEIKGRLGRRAKEGK